MEKAVVFVDFEHWLIACKNLYDIAPNIELWYEALKREYKKLDIYFFADFTNTLFKRELEQIRKISANIVVTRDKKRYLKKEITDFIMLDYIYQVGIDQNSPKTFIIFSGDGHFKSVVEFLKYKMMKEVVVYGVMGAFSRTLRDCASKVIELPFSEVELNTYIRMIVDNMEFISDHADIIATFNSIMKVVAKNNQVSEEKIKITLNWMLTKKYLNKILVDIEGKKIYVIKANWNELRKKFK